MREPLRLKPGDRIKFFMHPDGSVVLQVFTAMVALKEDRVSFADALIGALDAKAGCSATVTFDRKASRLDGFDLL